MDTALAIQKRLALVCFSCFAPSVAPQLELVLFIKGVTRANLVSDQTKLKVCRSFARYMAGRDQAAGGTVSCPGIFLQLWQSGMAVVPEMTFGGVLVGIFGWQFNYKKCHPKGHRTHSSLFILVSHTTYSNTLLRF